MSSKDFARICELYFTPGNKLLNVSVELQRDAGTASLDFETASGAVRVESSQFDAIMLAFQFRCSIGSEGSADSAVMKDLETYYAEIDELMDPEKKKLSAAIERVSSGEHEFGFKPASLVSEFIEISKPSATRFLPLKVQYFEVIAHFIADGHAYSTAHRKITVARPNAKRVYLAAEKTIRALWKGDSWLQNFVRLQHSLDLDLEQASKRLGQQLQTFENMTCRLSVHGAIPAEEGVQYLLDFYRRFSEVCSPLVNALRIAVETHDGEYSPEPKKRYAENCEVLRARIGGDVLLTLDPWIRHAESHLATQVMAETREVIVPRGRNERRVYTFAQISNMTEELIRDVVPGPLHGFRNVQHRDVTPHVAFLRI